MINESIYPIHWWVPVNFCIQAILVSLPQTFLGTSASTSSKSYLLGACNSTLTELPYTHKFDAQIQPKEGPMHNPYR